MPAPALAGSGGPESSACSRPNSISTATRFATLSSRSRPSPMNPHPVPPPSTGRAAPVHTIAFNPKRELESSSSLRKTCSTNGLRHDEMLNSRRLRTSGFSQFTTTRNSRALRSAKRTRECRGFDRASRRARNRYSCRVSGSSWFHRGARKVFSAERLNICISKPENLTHSQSIPKFTHSSGPTNSAGTAN